MSVGICVCLRHLMQFFIESAPLGRFDLVVAMSVCMYVVCPLSMRVFSRPLIGPYIRGLSSLALALPSALPSAHYHLRTTICALPSAHYHLRTTICCSHFFFWKNKFWKKNLYRSYYPHRSRDSLSPVCGIFQINHATSPKCYRSYYPHRSRDSLSPVCGIFFINFLDQVVKLVGGGSVINGAYPVQFYQQSDIHRLISIE